MAPAGIQCPGPSSAPARVAIEACREAWFAHDTLRAWGHQVLLVDTTRSRQLGIGQHGRKNDRIDAEQLARAVERGGIPLAHLLSPHHRGSRELLVAQTEAALEAQCAQEPVIARLTTAPGVGLIVGSLTPTRRPPGSPAGAFGPP